MKPTASLPICPRAAPGVFRRLLGSLEYRARLLQEHLPSLGQADPPSLRAVEESDAQFLLQTCHLLAHSRLR
jgi:hypothetical protein